MYKMYACVAALCPWVYIYILPFSNSLIYKEFAFTQRLHCQYSHCHSTDYTQRTTNLQLQESSLHHPLQQICSDTYPNKRNYIVVPEMHSARFAHISNVTCDQPLRCTSMNDCPHFQKNHGQCSVAHRTTLLHLYTVLQVQSNS